MKNFLTISLLIISLASSWAQPLNLSVAQLQEDYTIFRGTLERMHGSLYRYRAKAEIDQDFDRIARALNEPMNDLDFFRLLSPLIAKIQCGHTGIIPTQATRDHLFREEKLLPIKLHFQNHKAYFAQSFTKETLPITVGAEVLAINGLSIDSLINYSFSIHSSGDGWIKTGKMRLLNKVFNLYYVLYVSQPEQYEITYLEPDGNIGSFTVNALPEEAMIDLPEDQEKTPASIEYYFKDKSTAVLTVSSFENWKEGKKKVRFLKYLKGVFQRFDSAKVSNLIIDVRGNGGGDDTMGLGLFSYLHNEPIVEFNEIAFRTKKLHYAKYSDTNKVNFWFGKTFAKYKKVNDSTFHIVNSTTKLHPPGAPLFTGKVVVLIDGGSYSTTADFAALVKSYDKAILVGEETSGGYYGNTSGVMFTYTLPHSGIKFIVPLMAYWTNVKDDVEQGRGTMPTHQVQPSVQEILEGKDVQMEFALKLLED